MVQINAHDAQVKYVTQFRSDCMKPRSKQCSSHRPYADFALNNLIDYP